MSDVYSPPRSVVLNAASGNPSSGAGRGLYPGDWPLFSRSWTVLQPALVSAAAGTLVLYGIYLLVNIPANFVVAFLVGILVEAVGDGAAEIAITAVSQLGLFAISQVTSALMVMGMAQGSYKLVSTENVEVIDFLPLDPTLIAKGVLTQVLVALVVGLGTLMLFVPGVIAMLGLMLWPYAMVVEGHGPVDSLKRSWQLMDGSKRWLSLFLWAVSYPALFVVLFTCGVGSLVVMPFISVGYALIFVGAVQKKPALHAAD